jgi:hypothetical protein
VKGKEKEENKKNILKMKNETREENLLRVHAVC